MSEFLAAVMLPIHLLCEVLYGLHLNKCWLIHIATIAFHIEMNSGVKCYASHHFEIVLNHVNITSITSLVVGEGTMV